MPLSVCEVSAPICCVSSKALCGSGAAEWTVFVSSMLFTSLSATAFFNVMAFTSVVIVSARG